MVRPFPGGISRKSRQHLIQLLKHKKGCIGVDDVQEILKVSRHLARAHLSRWAKHGWIQRVRRGVYLPLPLETEEESLPSENAWVVAAGLFSPCYVGGWSAAQHWDFTEQIFNETLVLTTKPVAHSRQIAGGHTFVVRKIPQKSMFGTKTIWIEQLKIQISDPHKTIVDVLNDPAIGGGIRSVADFLSEYLKSEHKDLEKVMGYAFEVGNRTIFKRLGYLLTLLEIRESEIIERCRMQISKGHSQLDPGAKGKRLVKKWRLWVHD